MNKNKKIIGIITVLVILAIILTGIQIYRIKVYKDTYRPYAEKFNTFNFSERYNDGDSLKYKNVKKGESIALVLSAIYNTNDITEIGYNPLFEDKNAAWVRYAEVEGVIKEGSINAENVNKNAKMIDILVAFGKCKELFLQQEVKKDTPLNLKGIKKLSEEELKYVKDAVAMGIIPNTGYFNPNKKIKRGQFNKIILEYMNTASKAMALGIEIEENTANFPSNYMDYPFIVKGIDKSLYEIPFKKSELSEIQKPKEVYGGFKDISTIAEETIKQYCDLLLNVDYKNINEPELEKSYRSLMQFFPRVELVKEYAEYVKEHKLVIKGKATPLWPIIYYDGDVYRFRTKLDFEILEGDTKENVLLGDVIREEKSVYEDKNSIVIDMPLEYGVASHKLYCALFSVMDSKVK